MASPSNYEAEPLLEDTSIANDDLQMCEQLLRWLQENNLENEEYVSVSALKDALTATVPRPILSGPRIHDENILRKTICPDCKCHTRLNVFQDHRLYICGAIIVLAMVACSFAFLFTVPAIGFIVALSFEGATLAVLLLLAAYWWGRRGPPVILSNPNGQYLEVPSADIASNMKNMEYYA